MKPPPLLLGAALLFWGWQTGFLWVALLMGAILEGARLVQARWDFSNEDFQRIWTFCALLLLASLVYAFNANDGPADFRGLFQNPNYYNQRNAGTASAKTAASVIRWLPMIFFLFVVIQSYSTRDAIPLETISLIMRRRWRKAQSVGKAQVSSQNFNVSYFYFGLCLFASCIRTDDERQFFWGFAALLAWGLWPLRSQRYGFATWCSAVGVAVALGYIGQLGIGQMTRYLETLNSQLLSRLTRSRFDHGQSRTEMGRIGRIKTSAQIVLRLSTREGQPPPPLLREASYRTFKALTWYSEVSRSDFENIPNPSDTNQNTWILVPGKTNDRQVEISCYLRGGSDLLPLPTGAGRLENLSAYLLQKNSLGAVLAQGPGLVVFDALYSPGVTVDSPGNTNLDLSLPPREQENLDRALREIGLGRSATLQEARRAVAQFFDSKFSYSMWQDRRRATNENETPLGRFLFNTRSGHCEYFATSTVLLLRRLGFPARYAVGYAVHEGSGDSYVVRGRDAHAWCIVWNEATSTWDDFDTTPGSWVSAENENRSKLQFLGDIWSRIGYEFSKLRWGQTRLRQYVIWTLVPILGVLLYKIVFGRRRRKLNAAKGDEQAVSWPGLDSEFYQLERRLAERGVLRAAGEPLSAWFIRALDDSLPGETKQSLKQLLQLHYRYRFDPLGLDSDERARLRYEVRRYLSSLENSSVKAAP